MPHFRYPVAPPSGSVANPFSVPFDYLPEPLHFPLTPQEAGELYTTRIAITAAAAAAGGDRIAHVFPRANVRFLIADASLDTAVLAQKYSNPTNTEALPIQGIWISLGLPADIKDIRSVTGNELFPTVVVYHNVLIDRSIVRQSIIPLLETEKVITRAGTTETVVTDITAKVNLWLRGETKVSFPDLDNMPGHSFLMPTVPLSPTGVNLHVSAFLMDGTGADLNTLNLIQQDLRASLTSGIRLRDARRVIHIPFSYVYFVLPNSELAPGHANHPLANKWPMTPANWSAILFSLTTSNRAGLTDLRSDVRFVPLKCQLNSGPQFPFPATGLFFFRSTQTTNQVKVFDQANVQMGLNLFTRQGTPLSGTILSLTESQSLQGIYRIIIGASVAASSSSDHFFGVPRQRPNLQTFINELSARHMSFLTTAGAFARMMGYLAEMVANWLLTHPVTRDGVSVNVPPNGSFAYLLATAYEVIVTDDFKGLGGSVADMQGLATRLRNEAGLVFGDIARPDWLNTHEDAETGTGWRVFDAVSFDTSGRKDHFLFNAILRWDSTNAGYHTGLGIFNSGEDVKNDIEYNRRGELFAEWGTSEYNPAGVEGWILDNLVLRATVQ